MSDRQQSPDVVSDDPLNGWLAEVSVKLKRNEAGKAIYQVVGKTVIEGPQDKLNKFGARLVNDCALACLEKFGVNGVNNDGN